MISALIAKTPIALDVAKTLKLPVFIEDGFAVIALDEDHICEWGSKLGLSTKSTSSISFDCPTVHSFAKQLGLGKYALIETEYFGGVGEQLGAVFNESEIEMLATENGINDALRLIGVRKLPNKHDEFDTLNLGNYRSFSEYF